MADKTLYLSRTHPLVEGLAAYALNTALDPLEDGLAKRASVIRTSGVTSRVTLLCCATVSRIRPAPPTKRRPLAEACEVVGYRGRADNPQWLEEEEADALLRLTPEANVPVEQATRLLERTLERSARWRAALTNGW